IHMRCGYSPPGTCRDASLRADLRAPSLSGPLERLHNHDTEHTGQCPWARGGSDVTTYGVVGKPVTREDGPEKVSGQTCYSGDLMLPGMLWGKVLRSPLPHARIVHIDTSGASKVPGVHAVLTGRDLAGMLVGRALRDTPLLAQEKVRFVGEKVAAGVAGDGDTAHQGPPPPPAGHPGLPPPLAPAPP